MSEGAWVDQARAVLLATVRGEPSDDAATGGMVRRIDALGVFWVERTVVGQSKERRRIRTGVR
jgi:hypothetical protein